MVGYKLTTEQAELISKESFRPNCFFNPIQDINGDWFIFEGEVNGHITVEEFFWVRDLEPSEYVPPTTDMQ